MARKAQIPLKEILPAMDKKDRDWYDRLDHDQKKAFGPWMLLRYASSVQGPRAAEYLFMVNEFANVNFAEVSSHPELQWKLFAACGQGKVEHHQYIKPPTARKKKNRVAEFLLEVYPHLKTDELELLMKINSKQDFKQLAQAHGLDDKAIRDIFR